MKALSLGIPELDRSLGGGLPYPSLVSLEGEHGSGKTVFSQQIAYSMLREGFRVAIITSETSIRGYLSMMKSIRLDADRFFLRGLIRVYPLHVSGVRWSKALATLLLEITGNFLVSRRSRYDCAVVDSLSTLSLDAGEGEFMTFITKAKNLVSEGKTIVLTFHPSFMRDELVRILKASSDVYLVFRNASLGGMQVKVLQIVKLWGSSGERKAAINLEVNPNLGLRVLPIGEVRI